MNLRNAAIGFFALMITMFLCAPLALYLNAQPAVGQRIEHGFLSGMVIVALVLLVVIFLAALILLLFLRSKQAPRRNYRAGYRRRQYLPAGYVFAQPEPQRRRTVLDRFIHQEKKSWL
jgi:uncharacterized membrane protein